ncbi:MAG: hypothetical protein ACYTHM_02065 [Planctomycetota bacterium]
MQGVDVQLHDMGLRLYHPPLLLDPKKYVRLVESLCEFFPTQRREADAFEFSVSPAQTLRIAPQMTSMTDLFTEGVRQTTRHIFHVLGRVLDIMDVERIEAFDHMVSGRFQPPEEGNAAGYDEYPADLFVGKAFLKELDFAALLTGPEKPQPGVSWVYDLEDRSIHLRIESFPDDRKYVFIELSVQHPESNISLGDVRAAVEKDLTYLRENVVRFLQHTMERGPR